MTTADLAFHPESIEVYANVKHLVQPGDKVLVALSGGADSVALLVMLRDRRDGIALVAGHYNHRLRGAESDADEAFCRELCGRLGVPLHVGREAAPDPERFSEDRGRHARYAFLERVAVESGATKIATGHQADDQAETIAMRLHRGAGPTGLCGIPERRPLRPGSPIEIVRPLLEMPREKILVYLNERDLTYREDPTNTDPRFLRNRIRRQLEGASEARSTLLRIARCARRIRDALDRKLLPILERGVRVEGADRLLAVETLQRLPPMLRAELLLRFHDRHLEGWRAWDRPHLDAIEHVATERTRRGETHLPGGRAVREGDRLRFSRTCTAASD